MKRSDSFRKFFPGHVSVDKIIQNDETNRKRSQVSSNSQSQEFRSQSSHFHSSLNTLTSNSQVSSSNRYEDMLASGRHLELKDCIETVRKNVSSIAANISTQQSALSSNASQINDIDKEILAIKTTQNAQERTLSAICDLLFELKENVQEIKNCQKASDDGPTFDLDSSSQSGMSLDDYLSNRAKKVRVEGSEHNFRYLATATHTTTRTSRSGSYSGSEYEDVSMASGSSLKRHRSPSDNEPASSLPPFNSFSSSLQAASPRPYCDPNVHSNMRGPVRTVLPQPQAPPQQSRVSRASMASNVGMCDDSAGLLFDDF